jgi:serine/threonine protein phosphatase PrpC
MTNPSPSTRHRWAAFGGSARGAAHIRDLLPNEDAVAWDSDEEGRWAVVAVADGHGHAVAVRAAAGARLAVGVAIDRAVACCRDLRGADALLAKETAQRLQEEVTVEWQAALEADLASAPLSEAELASSGSRQTLSSQPHLAYGTTLLVTLAAGASIVAFQIGDGDVVAVRTDGQVLRPLPVDDRLVGTRTTSLASRTANSDFRASQVAADEDSIEVVIAATDGYVNSFSADDGFAEAGRDLWKLLHEVGPSTVQGALVGWLESTSSEGTGDDATLAILFDRSAIPVDRDERDTITASQDGAP